MVSHGENDDRAIIHNILTRKSSFARKAVGTNGQIQVVSSNIDIVFICTSLNNNYKLSRIERYLSIAWDSGATPVVVLTKADLCENIDEVIREVENVSLFAYVVTTSMFDDNVEKMSKYFKTGVTAAFIGSSGVGKSTLVNKLLGENVLKTLEIDKDDKGRHTTTGREMFLLPEGGVVIDTPGMREIGAETADLSKSFSDIEELELLCKFGDCKHQTEPGCAILKAIENGILDNRRMENYIKIKKETRYEGLSTRQIETIKMDEMFKDAGGMKKGKINYRNSLKLTQNDF